MRIMGILNLTEDSFSDGGRHADAGSAIAAAHAMVAAGAAMIDVGAESTRPGARAVAVAEECARLLPVVGALAQGGVAVSVDTRHAATMAACLEAGAVMINDVSGLTYDAGAAALVARAGCEVVLMHSRGTPETMEGLADYTDVVGQVAAELAARRDRAVAAGVARGRILLDPGLGFAKRHADSTALLAGLAQLGALGHPIVLGASRKRFVDPAAPPLARLGGSVAAALWAAEAGADMVRVHDVAETAQALHLWRELNAARLAGTGRLF